MTYLNDIVLPHERPGTFTGSTRAVGIVQPYAIHSNILVHPGEHAVN